MNNLRRVITGHGADGRSRVVIDGPPLGDGPLLEVWSAPPGPVDSRSGADQAAGPVRLCPPDGGSKFRYFTIAPLPEGVPHEALEAAFAERFAEFGAADARVDTTRHPSMHKTRTLDYIILLRGEVRLLLDEGEVDLKPGDVVVQRGTNHGWVCTGPEPALLCAILIDAEIR
jgi:hypothetical protein